VLTGYGNVPAAISLEADPMTLPANGVATAHLTATVTNAAGNPVPDGTEVRFETDLGSVGSKVITVTTSGGGGKATATLTSGTSAGTAHVSATSGGVSAATTVTFTPGSPDTVVLESAATSIPADGTSTAVLTATVTDLYGNAVADGTDVEFTTTLGQFGGQSAVTDQTVHGVVTVQLTSSTSVGLATVTATSGGETDSLTVDFFQGEDTLVDPGTGGDLTYVDSEDDTTTTVQVPAGAMTESATLRYTSKSLSPAPPNLSLAGETFQLDLYQDGEKIESTFFDKPITVTIVYGASALQGVDTASLTLYRWYEDAWQALTPQNFWPLQGKSESCGFDNSTDTLTCYLWKLSDFAPMAKSGYKVYLPLAIRK
jgi:hypothetical protein